MDECTVGSGKKRPSCLEYTHRRGLGEVQQGVVSDYNFQQSWDPSALRVPVTGVND